MHLPERNELPINLLAGCFNNTSATYKFYWFLSILQSIEEGKEKIDKTELFAKMISNAWYTVNYFHISFGKQDQLQRAIETIKESEELKIDDDRNTVYNKLIETQSREALSQVKYFDKQVPHWFLSPWFPGMTKQQIYQQSQVYTNNCPYALYDARIVINIHCWNILELTSGS
jgi:hypothetical protein